MNEIDILKIEQQPIINFDEDSNDQAELGLALLGLSAAQLSRSAKASLATSSDATSDTTEKSVDYTWNDNKDWGYMSSAASGGTRFDPNAGDFDFGTKFDPSNINAMIRQIQEMMAWMKANNMNLNAVPKLLAFFQSMGEAWNSLSADDKAKLSATLGTLVTANGQDLCKLLIDAMVQAAFNKTKEGDKEGARRTAQDLMNLFGGVDNVWFKRLYESAKWAYEHVDSLKAGLGYNKWVIAFEGRWGRFWNESNGDNWINQFYQQQIAEIMKLGNPELVVLMLMNLMVNRDNDGQTALGGLGAMNERMAGYVNKIKDLQAQFRKGEWTEQSAKEFCEALTDLGFDIDNNPNLDSIKGQINGGIGYFLNEKDPKTGLTVGELMEKGRFKDIADFFQSQMPNPANLDGKWEFYNGANQAFADMGSAVSGISQLTGQTMNTMQGTNQQREAFISAYLKGLTDLMSRINNNSKAAR